MFPTLCKVDLMKALEFLLSRVFSDTLKLPCKGFQIKFAQGCI